MSVDPRSEAPHQGAEAAGFSEAITFAFGDPGQRLFGVARVGLAGAPGPQRSGSGLALLFSDGQPVAVRADGGAAVEPEPGWADVRAAGVHTTVEEPLQAWTVAFDDRDGSSFALRFDALSAPAELEDGSPAAQAGGMQGYEQLCRVTGTVRTGGRDMRVACLGQRGRSWGAPDWEKIALARTVSGWLGEDLGFSVTAIRPARAAHHADEAMAAFLIERAPAPASVAAEGEHPVLEAPDGGLLDSIPVEDPRLSTTYDAEERQRHAGVELYVCEDDGAPRRAAGEVLCGTSLDLGRLRLDTAFFAWRMEGRQGVGRYDIVRRAA